MAERGATPEDGLDHPARRRRGGAPRGRARLRYWRVEHPRKVFRRDREPATGAAFRTSALAALHSLARGVIVARVKCGPPE